MEAIPDVPEDRTHRPAAPVMMSFPFVVEVSEFYTARGLRLTRRTCIVSEAIITLTLHTNDVPKK